MTVIDVNTGKFTGQGGNLEQTVTRNNLEAAEEIVRQLRLRDLGGIIVIDFIDMVLESNRELVLRRLLECLARDRTKHQVAEVTSLGLVQMTRKRVGSGLLEAFSVPCEHCNGRGVLISLEPVDYSHGRDSGRSGGSAMGDHPGGNGASRDGGGRDSGGRESGGRGSRGRGGSARREAGPPDNTDSDADSRSETADAAGPSPAVVASAGSRSRTSRSRSGRSAAGAASTAASTASAGSDADSPAAEHAGSAAPDATADGSLAATAVTESAASGPPSGGSGPNGSGRSRSGRTRRAGSAHQGGEPEPSGDGPEVEPANS
jgi:ribonuclease E